VAGFSKTLHNEELHNFYASPNIISMVKSRKIRGMGHAARTGTTGNACKILVGKPEGMRT
jgi:hypothetical protein